MNIDRRLLGLLAGNFIVATNFYIVAGLLDLIAADFAVSIAKAGLLISAFAMTVVVGAPVFATLGSHMDRRLLLVGTLGIAGVASAGAALAGSFEQLLVARVFAAVASAIFTPQAAASVGLLVPEARRASAITLIMIGWSLAGVAGVPLGVLIGTHFGWRTAMAVNMAGCAIVAVMLWGALPAGLFVQRTGLRGWLEVFRNPVLPVLMAATAAMSAANQTAFSYLAPLTRQVLGIEGAALSALYLVHGLASVTANTIAVMLLPRMEADRLGMFWIGFAIVSMALWPVTMLWLPLVFVLQFPWSLGLAGFPSVQQARLVHAAPMLAAASVALNSSAGYLGQAIGTSYGALIWSWTGPATLTWAALLPAAAGLWLSRIAQQRQRRMARAEMTPCQN